VKLKNDRKARALARKLKRNGSGLWLATPRAIAGRPVTYPMGRAHA